MNYTKTTHSKQIYKMRKQDSRAYLAGLIDGDGSIYVVRSKRKRYDDQFVLRLKVVSIDYDTILFLKSVFGGLVYKQKSLYLLCWNTKEAQRVINKIRSYLILKREQADLALSIINTSSSKSEKYYLKMGELNKNKDRQLINPKISKRLFWAYIAGLIDSDGSITIKNPKSYYPYFFLKISNNNKSLLEIVKTRVGLGFINQINSCYDFQAVGTSARYLVDKILPFLITRKERAELGLKFQLTKDKKHKSQINKDFQNRLIQEMRALNL